MRKEQPAMSNLIRVCSILLLTGLVLHPHGARAGRAAHATAPETDLWLSVSAPVAPDAFNKVWTQHLRLFVHSISDVACVASYDAGNAGDAHLFNPGVGLAKAGKDGILEVDTNLAVPKHPTRITVAADCTFPFRDQQGRSFPETVFRTSFVQAGKAVTSHLPPPALHLSVSPNKRRTNTPMTLTARTSPGALCGGYAQEGSTWYFLQPYRAGSAGWIRWNWDYARSGTAHVTCDNRSTSTTELALY
jgi:hypothetical protein